MFHAQSASLDAHLVSSSMISPDQRVLHFVEVEIQIWQRGKCHSPARLSVRKLSQYEKRLSRGKILMIKSPQPSVGVMKWLLAARRSGWPLRIHRQHMLRRPVEGTTFPASTAIGIVIIIKTFICYTPKSHVGLDSWGFAKTERTICCRSPHTQSCEQREGN